MPNGNELSDEEYRRLDEPLCQIDATLIVSHSVRSSRPALLPSRARRGGDRHETELPFLGTVLGKEPQPGHRVTARATDEKSSRRCRFDRPRIKIERAFSAEHRVSVTAAEGRLEGSTRARSNLSRARASLGARKVDRERWCVRCACFAWVRHRFGADPHGNWTR